MIKLKVTEQGVILPKHYFPDVQEVEMYLTEDGIFLKTDLSDNSLSWSEDFLKFEGIEDSIDFTAYRKELVEPKGEIF
jgi:hypothetical protein